MALTVAVFILLVKLGLWQWTRGEEKQLLESRLAGYQQMAPVSLKQALATYAPEQMTGVKVKVTFQPDTTRTFLLDNQTMDGQVGYLAYQLGRTADGDWLLVERGFVAAGLQRSMLPQVEWLQQVQSLTGRLYTRSLNPLSSQLLIEAGNPHRIQNLNLTELSRWLGETGCSGGTATSAVRLALCSALATSGDGFAQAFWLCTAVVHYGDRTGTDFTAAVEKVSAASPRYAFVVCGQDKT
ncbi:SURF1 family protein [Vibrio sp. CDRSL-10 TSBA]